VKQNPEKAERLLTLPNMLTSFRFVAAPVLLLLAWHGQPVAFLSLLAVAFGTDVLDGMAARLTGQESLLGAKLDSWADVTIYMTIAIGAWWLWPDVIRREALYAGMVIGSYTLPAVAGIAKYGTFTSYHTWLVKATAVCIGVSLFLLFLDGPALPFRLSAVLCIAAALEEIAITAISPHLQSNVRSLWHVWRDLRRDS